MNEVFENNAAITSIRNFYMNYRKLILAILLNNLFPPIPSVLSFSKRK